MYKRLNTSLHLSWLFDGVCFQGPSAKTHPTAFPEYTKQVPLTPKMDQESILDLYHASSVSMVFSECLTHGYTQDQGFKKYDGPAGPFAATRLLWAAEASLSHPAEMNYIVDSSGFSVYIPLASPDWFRPASAGLSEAIGSPNPKEQLASC